MLTESVLRKESAELGRENETEAGLVEIVNLIDALKPGQEQSEANHRFKGQNIAAGSDALGRLNRGGLEGGWFSYEVKVPPDKPAVVVCKYLHLTSAPERFDILLNGQKIATETFLLENNHADFFYKFYHVPETLTKGLNHATLRFQAHPGNFTGQLLNVQIFQARLAAH
jgi:hypothetical protein